MWDFMVKYSEIFYKFGGQLWEIWAVLFAWIVTGAGVIFLIYWIWGTAWVLGWSWKDWCKNRG